MRIIKYAYIRVIGGLIVNYIAVAFRARYIFKLFTQNMDYPFPHNVTAHLYSHINAGENSAFGMRVISINNRGALNTDGL